MLPRSALKLTRGKLLCAALACCLWGLAASQAAAAEWKFQVAFSREIHPEPFTGRVCILFSKGDKEPRLGPGWFKPEPFVSLDVEGWKPEEPLVISSETPGLNAFPEPLAKLAISGMKAQAVIRFNSESREVGTGAGNGYSQVSALPEQEKSGEAAAFRVDRLVLPHKLEETKWSRLLEVRSAALSDFHKREVSLRGAVVLPASYYDAPERRYPVMFTIPGFGGTHFDGRRDKPVDEENEQGIEFVRVFLDPSCPLGHHVFADSANNGPVGAALITEFIPELDRQYRTLPLPTARFLTGHSSGGWSSLWLQVTYPDVFGGTWSTAPDPVDFRDFQRINLYAAGENMYRDHRGARRPIARRGQEPVLWYEDFAAMEQTLGPGGQLHSFEAVFSPRGADGRPRQMWDWKTGEIDSEVADTWMKYDIRLVLERDWVRLGPKLQGKLHIFMGELDTFYLEGATRLLRDSLAGLGSDAVVEFFPEKDHSNLMTKELVLRIRREMVQSFLKHHGK